MDFNEVIDRRGTYCTQWDYIEDRFGKGTKDLTPFSISDMDFKSPQKVIDTIFERVSHGVFGYSRWNHNDYKSSIKEWYLKRYKTDINEEWIVYSPTVLYSISLIVELIAGARGKVMTHTPRYDGFSKILSKYDLCEVKLTQKDDGIFYTDFEAIEEGFKKGVKVFLLCNPENPTGKIWTQCELLKLINLSKQYGVIIISDDIHMDIARKEVTPILKLDSENSLIVSSPSKTFNIPSLGGSYAIIPDKDLRERFIEHIKNVDSLSSAPILGILATMVAYNQCEEWVDELNKYLTKNCELVVKELNGYKGLKAYIPEATYLMWIDFKDAGLTPEQFKEALINIGKVAIMSGENYGDSYKIRLNVGASISKIQIGIEGIKRAVDYLKM